MQPIPSFGSNSELRRTAWATAAPPPRIDSQASNARASRPISPIRFKPGFKSQSWVQPRARRQTQRKSVTDRFVSDQKETFPSDELKMIENPFLSDTIKALIIALGLSRDQVDLLETSNIASTFDVESLGHGSVTFRLKPIISGPGSVTRLYLDPTKALIHYHQSGQMNPIVYKIPLERLATGRWDPNSDVSGWPGIAKMANIRPFLMEDIASIAGALYYAPN